MPPMRLCALVVGVRGLVVAAIVEPDDSIATLLAMLSERLANVHYPQAFTAYSAKRSGRWLVPRTSEDYRALGEHDAVVVSQYLIPDARLDPSKKVVDYFGHGVVPETVNVLLEWTSASWNEYARRMVAQHAAKGRVNDGNTKVPLPVLLKVPLKAIAPGPCREETPLAPVRLRLHEWGGSRGNPGPGGSGACVVRVGALSGCAEIVWSAAMSHASPNTTNNQAEYNGLLAGLRAARDHDWPSLEVVGDSMMIVRQLRDYRPPKNVRLLQLYSEARRLGDQLDIRRWTHHVRANNRMADALANHAMDGQTSSQVSHPTARRGHADLHAHLGTDLRPWLAFSRPPC